MENKELRAALTWDTLVEIAKNETFIQYSELSDKIGLTHSRPLRHYMRIVQSYCLENKLPPLTILAADKFGIPGKGFIAWDEDNIDEGKRKVYGYNWANLLNPFSYAKEGLTENQIINELLTNPDNSSEIFSRIKSRGTAQIIFRKALLKAYKSHCVICNVTLRYLLEACHIIPWSQSQKQDRLDIRNGILFCANHHKLFDNGYFLVNDDYSVDLSVQVEKNKAGDSILNLSGKQKLGLPTDQKLWPKLENLKHHRNSKRNHHKITNA